METSAKLNSSDNERSCTVVPALSVRRPGVPRGQEQHTDPEAAGVQTGHYCVREGDRVHTE